VKSLEDYCFSGCTSLSSLIIPKSVISLGHYCFLECSSISSLIIPTSVILIGEKCFQNCFSLQNFSLSFRTSLMIQPEGLFKKALPFFSYPSCPFSWDALFIQIEKTSS
jgi:hypothetical protein